MSRTLAEQITTLRHVTQRKVDVNLSSSLLPRGTNSSKPQPVISSREERPKIRTVRGSGHQFNLKDHYSVQRETRLPSDLDNPSPEYVEGVRRSMLRLPNTVVDDAIRLSRHHQSINGQAETVERHMGMTKPVSAPYKTLEELGGTPAHDRANDWQRKVDVNLRAQLLRLRGQRELSAAIDRRLREQENM